MQESILYKTSTMNNIGEVKMKRRMWVVGGSIETVVLLILAMLPTVVSTQVVKSNEIKANVFQHFIEKNKNNNWAPGDIITSIILLIVITIIFFMSGQFFY